jgi:hypothetical protein
MRKQQVDLILVVSLDLPVLTGAYDQIHIGGTSREMLVDVAFSVRDVGNAVGLHQYFTGAYRPIDPALRFLVRGLSRASMLDLASLAVPHLGIDQPDHCAGCGVHGQSGVQQKAAQRTALSDHAIAVRLRPMASQCQLTRILDHHNITPGSPGSSALPGVARHLGGRYRMVAQEARELNLPRPCSRQPADTRAWPRHQRRMEGGPPFSRRRSPNRPSPYSIPVIGYSRANHRLIHGITIAIARQDV